ncbi:MAG: Secretion system C-terminal sorting domain [Bacteroidota bacterium]
MKKLLFSVLAIAAIGTVQAQVTFSTTNKTIDALVGTQSKPYIVVKNTGTMATSIDWNLNTTNTVLPANYTGVGICSLPGSCYAWDNTVRTYPIAAGDSMFIEPIVSVPMSAAVGTPAVVKVDIVSNTGNQELTFTINPVIWPTSISNVAANNIKVVPNPALNNATVVGTYTSVELYNVMGQRVISPMTNTANATILNVEQLPAGIYIVKAFSSNGVVAGTSTLSVQH